MDAPTPSTHVPVLLREVVQLLALRAGDDAIDCTFGSGGYTDALLAATAPNGRVLSIDRDADAIARGRAIGHAWGDRQVFVHGNFDAVRVIAEQNGFRDARAIVADLGFSSDQLRASHRGFSFMDDGPLDMRFDPLSDTPTAAELLRTTSVLELERIIRTYGEERHARVIAQSIVDRRRRSPIATTTELREVIQSVIPRRGRIHPATRTFQALRIAVNDELGTLEHAIPQMMDLVAVGGRIAIVSFHSLEDRIVKRAFRSAGERGWGALITKRPVTPSVGEIANNSRSRSAKLRVIERR